MVRSVRRYFSAFADDVKAAIDKNAKVLRRQYEVSFKTGRLFAEDKLKSHYKESKKLRRQTFVQVRRQLQLDEMHSLT